MVSCRYLLSHNNTTDNMKVLLVSAALVVALCAAAPADKSAPAASSVPAAPAAPKGWKPSGRLFLVPARLESPQAAEETKSRVLDSGEYYVLLEDGRLQMVRYTTATLDDKPADNPADKAAVKSAKQEVAAGPFARFQVEYLQYPRPATQPEAKPAQQKEQEAAGFEANLQYRDVKPISAPIYAPNSAPLVRILKK